MPCRLCVSENDVGPIRDSRALLPVVTKGFELEKKKTRRLRVCMDRRETLRLVFFLVFLEGQEPKGEKKKKQTRENITLLGTNLSRAALLPF